MQENQVLTETINGSIHYETKGSGAPLLLLAGGPGLDPIYMSALMAPLSKKYKVVLLHQRGTGRSAGPNVSTDSITLAQYLEDIEAVREHLGVEIWSVLGHSWGGMLAAAYTAEHPTRISDLILVNSIGITLDVFSYLTDNVLQRLSGHLYEKATGLLTAFLETNDPKLLGQFFFTTQSSYFFDKELVGDFVQRIESKPISAETYALLVQDLVNIQFDLRARLKSFEGNAIYIISRQDVIGPQPLLDCQASFKDLKVHTIEKAGHYPWEEQPDLFYDLLV